MWFDFFLENIHFAINLFTSLVFFAVFWLYLDAWMGRKTVKDTIKIIGLALLSISFLIHASHIESTVLEISFLSPDTTLLLVNLIKMVGFLSVILSLFLDPIQPKPQHTSNLKRSLVFWGPGTFFTLGSFLSPLLSGMIAFLYLRRATLGLENHLKTVALAFFVLSISDLVQLLSIFRLSNNPNLYQLLSPFGLIWGLEHALLLVAALILGKWVFGYLLKRLQSQLFMFLTCAVVLIFLITTVSFTALLLKNLQNEALKQIETSVKVLEYAVESKKAENLSDTQVLAQNPQIQKAIESKDRVLLSQLSTQHLISKKQNFLVIVSKTGQVLARGDDQERVGDSLSDDILIKKALFGEPVSSIITKEGIVTFDLSIRSASPIKKGQEIIGVVMSGVSIDNAFVDGIKSSTGLESAIFSADRISAATLTLADGITRATGIKIGQPKIMKSVLQDGKSYTGAVDLLGVPFFGAYLPLKDVDQVPVGMLFVANKQSTILQSASRSIELTFMVTILLIVLSILPSFMISKSIARQLE